MSGEPTEDGTDHDVWPHEAFRAGSAAAVQPGEHVAAVPFPTAPVSRSWEETLAAADRHARAWPPRGGS